MPRKDLDRRRPDEIWRMVSVADRRLRASLEPPIEDRSDRRPASPRGELAVPFMLDMVSLFIGIIALALVLFASIPFIATADWLILPMAVAGLALGLFSGSMAGLNLNLFVILIYLIISAAGS